MKNLSTRWLTMMWGTILGFRGKAPAKKTKGRNTKGRTTGVGRVHRYRRQESPEARRQRQIADGMIGYWTDNYTVYHPPGRR